MIQEYKKSIIDRVKAINEIKYLKLIDKYISHFYRGNENKADR